MAAEIREEQPDPPITNRGALEAFPALILFEEDDDSKIVTVTADGLTPGAEFRYRLERENGLIALDSMAERTLLVGGEGQVSFDVAVQINRSLTDPLNGSSTLRIVTSSGTLLLPVAVVQGVAGQYSGTLSVNWPWRMGTFPFAIEVWPNESAHIHSVKIVIPPEDNLIFVERHVVHGTFDAETRRLTFAFRTRVHQDDLERTDSDDRPKPVPFDLLGQVLSRDIDGRGWDRLDPANIENPFHRYLGREIQVSLLLGERGGLTGIYAEILHAALPQPINVTASLELTRTSTLEAMRSAHSNPSRTTDYDPPPFSPTLATSDMPTYRVATTRPLVQDACRDREVDECFALTTGSFAETLNACGDAAFHAAFGLRSELADFEARGGDAYRQAYRRCTGLADVAGHREVLEPRVATRGCVDPDLLTCAYAAYDAAATTTVPTDLYRSYRGLFRALRAASQAYAYLGNEYLIAAIRAPLQDTGEPTQLEAEALTHAAYAYNVAQAILTQPALLDELASAPTAIPGGETESENMHRLSVELLREALLTLNRGVQSAADAAQSSLRTQWLQVESPWLADEQRFLKRIGLSTYLQSVTLGQVFRDRRLRDDPSLSALQASFASLYGQFISRRDGLNPLGYDPSFVPLVDRRAGDLANATNFELLYMRVGPTNPVSALSSSIARFDDFQRADDQWDTASSALRTQLADRIDGYADRLSSLCDAPPNTPFWDARRNEIVPTPSPAQIAEYERAKLNYVESCVSSGIGPVGSALNRIEQALTQIRVAEDRVSQQRVCVEIESNRVERIAGTRNRYLTYSLENLGELTALQLADQDLQIAQLERQRLAGMFGAIGSFFSQIAATVNAAFKGDIAGAVEAIAGPALQFAGARMGQDAAIDTARKRRALIERRGEIERRQAALAVEQSNALDVINSEAVARQCLIRSAELLLELELAGLRFDEAVHELDRMLKEVSQQLAERDRVVTRLLDDSSSPFSDPTFRVDQDRYSLAFREAFSRAQRDTFELLRALEYDINAATGLEGEVFAAATPQQLVDFHGKLARVLDCYGSTIGAIDSGFESVISLRRDVFGVVLGWSDPVTGVSVSVQEQFQRQLRTPATINNRDAIEVVFETELARNEATGFAVSSTSRCNEQIRSLEVQLVGDGVGTASGAVQLEQEGIGLLRACDSRVGIDHASDSISGYNLAATSPTTASLQAGVNAWSGSTSVALASRPVAATRWRLRIDPRDPANRNLDVSRLEDVLIRIRSAARSLPPGGITFRTDRCRNL